MESPAIGHLDGPTRPHHAAPVRRRGWWPTRVDLSLRTRELYAGLLKNWIYAEVKRPTRPSLLLGDTPVMQ
ncbi:MAG: hypothetical protein ABR925_00005, partial [Acidimicrobiales bacterium]